MYTVEKKSRSHFQPQRRQAKGHPSRLQSALFVIAHLAENLLDRSTIPDQTYGATYY